MFLAAISPISRKVAALALDICGVMTTLGTESRGSSGGVGSGSVTSRAAPAIKPSRSASYSALGLTVRPLEALIR